MKTSKFWMSAAAVCFLFASGCANTGNHTESVEITLYSSNENADGFDTKTITLDELTAEAILKALAEETVVPADVALLGFEQEKDRLTLDLSNEYQAYIAQMGAAGEYVMVGSLVNTFLDAYGAEAILLLVDGSSWSSGDAEYETLQGKYSF